MVHLGVFEYHQINSPFDQEALEIKNCQSKITAKRFAEIIDIDIKNMKKEFMNDSFVYVDLGLSPVPDPILSFSTDIEFKMNEHIVLLERFLEFNSKMMATATYTKEAPIAAWENDIKNIHNNEKGTPNRDFSDSMVSYKTERNRTFGPVAQIFTKYWEVIETPAMLHHMSDHIKTNLKITDIQVNENVDYSFWKENKEMLERIKLETGVPIEILVGIIGVETYFGRITGKDRVIDALSTLAFEYPPRSKFFRKEYFLIKILNYYS